MQDTCTLTITCLFTAKIIRITLENLHYYNKCSVYKARGNVSLTLFVCLLIVKYVLNT